MNQSPIPIQSVVLCGGSGTRLWPLSRADYPKQFLSLFGQESLFQLALARLAQLAAPGFQVSAPLVVGNEEHRFLMLDQVDSAARAPKAIVLEPVGRNTAPALALAAHAADGDDPVLVVSPADHIVQDVPAYIATVQRAVRLAADGAIVMLGILPDRPETGFGYMHVAPSADDFVVRAFAEKPDTATAERYLREGNYFWNSGMFMLRRSVWQTALARFRPDIADAVAASWRGHTRDAAFLRPDAALFAAVPAESVDYAVMEKAPGALDVRMVQLAAGWSDLGTWDAAWQSVKKTESGNATVGDVMLHDSHDVYVHASSRLVAVAGLSNVVVVETPDAILVADRAYSQDIKQVVAALGDAGRGEHLQHRKVYRPWGWYDSIDEGARFKVKRIMVRPGASLSLQKHHKRSEHWVVVSGTAEITCGDKTMLLYENQSTYIPQGIVHRLANPTDAPLEIIEVQSGDYLGEDDIVRLEDKYGRTANLS